MHKTLQEDRKFCDKPVIVDIEDDSIVKPFLGGYVDTKTDTQYHNALTQTGPSINRIKYSGIVTKSTQTVEQHDKCADTPHQQASQNYGDAAKQSHLITNPAREYDLFASLNYKRDGCKQSCFWMEFPKEILLLQRNIRRFLLQKKIRLCASKWRQICMERKGYQQRMYDNFTNQFKKESFDHIVPLTKEYFDVIYSQINAWKTNEIERINKNFSDSTRLAELSILLDKEVQLLNNVNRQKASVRKSVQDRRVMSQLNRLSKPIQWIGYKGILIDLDTLYTQQVRTMTDLYTALKESSSSVNDRVELINNAITTLRNEPAIQSQHVSQLIQLYEREQELLAMECPIESLQALRSRQLKLLLDYILAIKVADGSNTKSIVCDKCHAVRPIAQCALHTRLNVVNICNSCTYLMVPATDNAIYQSILETIRLDERKRGALLSYAFLMQPDDIRQIIENIWHGHSIVNKSTVRSNLRLPRFNVADDWAPWNCICLTETEARAHQKLGSKLEQLNVYNATILSDVAKKNTLARSIFSQLFAIDFSFVESGEWWNIGLDNRTIYN